MPATFLVPNVRCHPRLEADVTIPDCQVVRDQALIHFLVLVCPALAVKLSYFTNLHMQRACLDSLILPFCLLGYLPQRGHRRFFLR